MSARLAFAGWAESRTIVVRPGSYLLTRANVTTKWRREDKWKNITLKEFVAPAASIDQTYVLHQPLVEATAGQNLLLSATIVSPQPISRVDVVAYLPKDTSQQNESARLDEQAQPGRGNGPGTGEAESGGARTFEMKRLSGFRYAVEIPGDQVHPGTLRYHIAVQRGNGSGYITFPSQTNSFPTDWDFYGEPWRARIVPAHAPILLFDAAADSAAITAQERDLTYELVPSDRPGTTAMDVVTHDLALGEHDHSFRFFFREKIAARTSDLGAAKKLVVYGRSATDTSCPVQLALISANGIAYGGIVTIKPEHGAYAIPVSALRQVRAPNIPHGYPVFIHFWSSIGASVPLDLNRIESVLISIGPGIPAGNDGGAHGIQIERIWLE